MKRVLGIGLRARSRRSRGVTLLELAVVLSLMGVVLTSLVALLRCSAATWEACDSDHTRLEVAHGVIRHFVRGLRQATAVEAITTPQSVAGDVTLSTLDGHEIRWRLDSNTQTVSFLVDGSPSELAQPITELSFEGLKADGTPTQVPAEIRAIRAMITVSLDRDQNQTRTIRCTGWIRTKSS